MVDAPNGISAPRGLPREVEDKLQAALRFAVASDEFKAVAGKIDAPVMYLDGPDYLKYVKTVYDKETLLIKRLKLKEMLAKVDAAAEPADSPACRRQRSCRQGGP